MPTVEELEQRVAELERDNERLTQLAQSEKMAAISKLARQIAHDLNNMMGAIVGTAWALKSDLPPDSPLRTDVETIMLACERGHELTRKLRGFATTSAREKTPVSLNESVAVVRALLRRAIPESIEVDEMLDADLEIFDGDVELVNEALINLAINAADAMQSSGTLTFITENVVLNDASAALVDPELRPGRYVRIQVMDTGVGMDRETLQRAFEPFFTTKPKEIAAGLGLSKVYGTAMAHRGTAVLESHLGQGTTASIYFPTPSLQRRTTDPGAGCGESGPLAAASGTILLIDDEELVRRSGERLLTRLGYEVMVAGDAKTAVKIYREHRDKIDLVVLDLVMPGVGGEETLQWLKAINPAVRVLPASGHPKEAIAAKLRAFGVSSYLEKPFDMAQLGSQIARSLVGARDE